MRPADFQGAVTVDPIRIDHFIRICNTLIVLPPITMYLSGWRQQPAVSFSIKLLCFVIRMRDLGLMYTSKTSASVTKSVSRPLFQRSIYAG